LLSTKCNLYRYSPERANTIFNYMMSNDVPRTEMTYTALAAGLFTFAPGKCLSRGMSDSD
jgi:hypothetical protein